LVWSENPTTYVLNKPLIYEPGKRFKYNGGGIFLLGEIIKSATSFVSNARGNSGYSLAWWTLQYELKAGMTLNMFYVHGWGGQYIMVLPELNSVIVFTGANYQTVAPYFTILERYVLPAFN